MVGQNPGELAPEPPLAGLLPGSIEQAFDIAERDNPQIRAAQYTEQASRERVAGARALQSHVITRAQLALEQLLDRLERGELSRRSTDSLLGAIVAAATAVPPRRP